MTPKTIKVTVALSEAQFECLSKIAALFQSDVATVLHVSGIGALEAMSAEDTVDMWDDDKTVTEQGHVSDALARFLTDLTKIRDWERRYCRSHPGHEEQSAAWKRGNVIGYRAEEVPHVS